MSSTLYATKTAGMAAAARPCSWRTRGVGHVSGGCQLMSASDLKATFPTAHNAIKRFPRRLAERLT